MARVSWQDFDNDSALERNVLERALPLVMMASTPDGWRATFHMTGDTPRGMVQTSATSSPTSTTEPPTARPRPSTADSKHSAATLSASAT